MAKTEVEQYVEIDVPVIFRGTIRVRVPAKVPGGRRRPLAEHRALCQSLATLENPDAPEDDACVDYGAQFNLSGKIAERDWDGCQFSGISGVWELPPRKDSNA